MRAEMTGEGPFDTTQGRVLVVEDERTIATLLELQLEARGLEVVVADSGEAALSRLRLSRFGCALIDKNLPGVDGLEVMRRAREMQPNCRCIMITAYGTMATAVDALRAGAVDFVEKPFDDLELVVQKVRNAIEQERLAGERDLLLQRLGAYDARLDATKMKIDDLRVVARNGLTLRAHLRDRLPELLEIVHELAAAAPDDRSARLATGLEELLDWVGPPKG